MDRRVTWTTRDKAEPIPRARVDGLARLVADGSSVAAAGDALGLTKGQTASVWRRIKLDLGPQAR